MKALRNFLIIFFFVISCQNSNNTSKNQIATFDLKELPEITNLKLSDLGFAEIEYIPLETNENSIISRINEIKVGEGFYLIQYYNTILKFQDDGSFVTKIGTVGRGPNEFVVAHCVDIDTKNQNIYLVSGWQKKFNVYSENGEFIRTFHSPRNAINFRITEGGILSYSTNYIANVDTSYNLIDTDGRLIKSFPNRFPWNYSVQQGTVVFDENIFYRFNNQLFKKEIYSDTVYVFENLDFKPHLVIEQGNKLLTTQARSYLSSSDFEGKYISQWSLFEFGNYIYYEFTFNRKRYSFIGSKKNRYQALINSEQGLINDLDGGPNILPKSIKDDNSIIGFVDAIQLKTYIASDNFKNSIPKYAEKKKELEKLANSLKETDNPVLMIVRLKK